MHFSVVLFCFVTLLPLAHGLVDCPDDPTNKCPDHTTCCPMGGGKFGCCHVVSAVCCSDHLHCCYVDTICNITAGECTGRFPGKHLPLLQKTPAFVLQASEP
uniref:Granulins domain-containing protein n=1 Tax=Panagrolaimus sp. ES5 TaxID=591445 RepID=A0AC34FS60_9BILA